MSISTKRSLEHMSWANQEVYRAVQSLEDKALGSFIVNPEWTAGQILQHIASGADWYVYCLTGAMWHENLIPDSIADVAVNAKVLAEYDAIIIAEAEKDDELLSIQMEDGVFQHWWSTLIAQAIHHATEHRAQLIDALEFRGYRPINLDDIDLWAFEKI